VIPLPSLFLLRGFCPFALHPHLVTSLLRVSEVMMGLRSSRPPISLNDLAFFSHNFSFRSFRTRRGSPPPPPTITSKGLVHFDDSGRGDFKQIAASLPRFFFSHPEVLATNVWDSLALPSIRFCPDCPPDQAMDAQVSLVASVGPGHFLVNIIPIVVF